MKLKNKSLKFPLPGTAYNNDQNAKAVAILNKYFV